MASKKKSKRSGFSYRENTAAAARKASSGAGDYDSPFKREIRLWKPKEGKNVVRILPRTWDDESGPPHWAFEVYLHYDIGPDNAAYLCPLKMQEQECPVCNERNRLASEGDERGASDLRASKAMMAYIIDRNNEAEGVQLWRMPWSSIHNEISDRSEDEDGELLKIDHPDDGYDITFKRTGTMKKTTYTSVDIDRRSSPLTDDDVLYDEWLDFIEEHPIPGILNFYSTEYIEKVFAGTKADSGDEDEDDIEEEYRPRRRRKGRSELDEEELDDEEEDEDEDEEEYRPRRSRRSRSEPDDDELDDEDEDDDPEPRRSRRKSRRDVQDDDEGEELDDEEEDEDDDRPARSRGARSSKRGSRGSSRRKSDLRDEVEGGLKRRRR